MALTQDQINRRTSAENNLKSAQDVYNVKAAECGRITTLRDQSRQAALECQAKRDAENGGIRKNNACPIDTLSRHNSNWGIYASQLEICQSDMNQLQANVNNAKATLDSVTRQIDLEVTQAIGALQTDPQYQLSKARLDADAHRQEAEIKAKQAEQAFQEAVRKAEQKETLVRFGLILLIVVIIGVVIVQVFRKGGIKLPGA